MWQFSLRNIRFPCKRLWSEQVWSDISLATRYPQNLHNLTICYPFLIKFFYLYIEQGKGLSFTWLIACLFTLILKSAQRNEHELNNMPIYFQSSTLC
jgi:hypothetical protein